MKVSEVASCSHYWIRAVSVASGRKQTPNVHSPLAPFEGEGKGVMGASKYWPKRPDFTVSQCRPPPLRSVAFLLFRPTHEESADLKSGGPRTRYPAASL